MDVNGKAAIITGGGSGIGAEVARHCVAAGMKVALLDVNMDGANTVAAEIGAVAVECDVTSADSAAAAIASARETNGVASLLVNCAGIAPPGRIVGRNGPLPLEAFAAVIQVNLIGTYNVMTYATQAMMDMPALENGERGVIINTASAAYEDGQIGQSAYAASKGGIASMCLPAARELARPGIRVMTIAPGLFNTPMMESLPEETVAEITRNIPHPNRLGHPSEFAQLAGDIVRNPYLNGTVIRLDGATRLPPR